jgi:antirestriction protein
MPRIYVASLADYNAGRLHGRWIDAAQDADDTHAEIRAMLASSREPVAEEWAIHDYDDFGAINLGEYESIEKVAGIAQGIEEHGEAFAAFLSNDSDATAEQFEEAYRGTYRTVEDFADELIEEGILGEIPEALEPYIDTEKFAHDLEVGGDIFTVDGGEGVFIFWSNY